jgi:hypothetical protein
MISVPSENMLALRKLTAEISLEGFDSKYYNIVVNLKKLVSDGSNLVKTKNTNKEKIKCYENMCVVITDLLKNIKT